MNIFIKLIEIERTFILKRMYISNICNLCLGFSKLEFRYLIVKNCVFLVIIFFEISPCYVFSYLLIKERLKTINAFVYSDTWLCGFLLDVNHDNFQTFPVNIFNSCFGGLNQF